MFIINEHDFLNGGQSNATFATAMFVDDVLSRSMNVGYPGIRRKKSDC